MVLVRYGSASRFMQPAAEASGHPSEIKTVRGTVTQLPVEAPLHIAVLQQNTLTGTQLLDAAENRPGARHYVTVQVIENTLRVDAASHSWMQRDALGAPAE